MADFFPLSDTDESAVEQILAEAMDHCVLEQVAAINCSFFSNSVLPSNLESRFQRLKTFPSSSSHPIKPQIPKNPQNEFKHSDTEFKNSKSEFKKPENEFKKSENEFKKLENEFKKSENEFKKLENEFKSSVESEKPISDDSMITPEKKTVSKSKSQSGYLNSSPGSSNSSSGYLNSPKIRAKNGDSKGKDGNFSSGHLSSPEFRPKRGGKKGKGDNFSPGSNSFSSNSSESSTKKVNTGCFWCSPKRVSKKKSGNRNGDVELGYELGKHEKLLSDLKTFSEKKQKNLMKFAKMEEEKVNKEAEKIVKWAKQTSARLDFSVIHDDDLSDDDIGHNFGSH